MGIPSYFSFIIKHHPNTIVKLNKLTDITNLSNLFIDANSIIYDSLKDVDFNHPNFELTINKNVCNKIDNLIQLFNINNEVVIAFDGVAPLAKLEQQRTRRYKSSFINNLEDKPTSWNTSNITPGTQFMKQLMEYIHAYYDKPKFNTKKILIFSSNEPGEGEHKIFKYFRNNKDIFTAHLMNHNINIVYGLDADLIMLSLIHTPYFQNIFLYRETPEFIKSINSSFKIHEHYLMDIRMLKSYILEVFTKYYNKNGILFYNSNYKILDYIFICFMLGNDFLPHFPSLNIRTNGFDNLLYAYCNTIKPTQSIINSNKNINWKLFRKLCEYLYENEENNIKTEIKLRKNMNKNYNKHLKKYKTIEHIPILNQEVEDSINIYEKNWQNRYYKLLFDIDYHEETIKDICLNYLQGLEWTFYYYTNDCVNWQWKYDYHYPPLFEDLMKYIPYFETKLVEENFTKVSPITQLCYVLPRISLDLLPNNIKEKLLEKLDNKYPIDYEFSWAFCKYFWESHILLPELSIQEIDNAIK